MAIMEYRKWTIMDDIESIYSKTKVEINLFLNYSALVKYSDFRLGKTSA